MRIATGNLDSKTSLLLDEAIDLMIRRQGAPDNAVTLQTISVWRARSAEHERIWQRVSEAHGLSGIALGQPEKPQLLTRRNLMIGGAMAFGTGSLGTWGVPRLRLHLLADHITNTAELLPLELPDGSRITLGPDSAIATHGSGDLREIRLLQGMAWCNVAHDPARPFTLRLERGVDVTTAGATFEVARDAGVFNIAVAENLVEMAGPSRYVVEAGHWLRLDAHSGAHEEGPRDPSLVGAWQQGTIIAEAEPLEALVARIARWLPGRVVVADSAIGHARISGLFDLSDPERALEAAVRPTGGQLRRISGLLTVISSV